jgi:hypothetical protein
MKAPNLNNFGKKFKLKKRVQNARSISEYNLFIETIVRFDECWNNSNELYKVFKINLLEYEEQYYQIIENLLLLKYGTQKTEVVLWYIFGRIDDKGNVKPVIKNKTKIILSTPSELWEFLETLDREEKDDKNSEDIIQVSEYYILAKESIKTWEKKDNKFMIIKELAVVASTYTNQQGEEKKVWKNIGAIHTSKEGWEYMVLDPLVNLAAIPRKDGDNRVFVSMFEPKEKGKAPAQSMKEMEDINDEIPF